MHHLIVILLATRWPNDPPSYAKSRPLFFEAGINYIIKRTIQPTLSVVLGRKKLPNLIYSSGRALTSGQKTSAL